MKVIISKSKRDKIESLLFAGAGAIAMTVSMNKGYVGDDTIRVRDRFTEEIMNILDNKK